ncbi:hypothetical protein [Nocardia sp. NPDC006630]|uniref:hypothetical protein n=1 Tax=Nocardia sp. NPDC006630 TaxID=3157181 RepID=UPI0033B88D5D
MRRTYSIMGSAVAVAAAGLIAGSGVASAISLVDAPTDTGSATINPTTGSSSGSSALTGGSSQLLVPLSAQPGCGFYCG